MLMQRNVDANAGSFRKGRQVAKVRRLDLDFALPEDPGHCGEGMPLTYVLSIYHAPRLPGSHPQSRYSSAQVRVLVFADAESAGRFDWQVEDIAELREVEVVLAADVIYDDDLTLAFMQCMDRFLGPSWDRPGAVHAHLTKFRATFASVGKVVQGY